MILLAFIVGVFIGAVIGFFAMALAAMSRQSRSRTERWDDHLAELERYGGSE